MKIIYVLIIISLLGLLFWTNKDSIKYDYPVLKPVIVEVEKLEKKLEKNLLTN